MPCTKFSVWWWTMACTLRNPMRSNPSNIASAKGCRRAASTCSEPVPSGGATA